MGKVESAAAKKQIDAMLAAETDPLTRHDIASETTWADRYGDSNHRKDHYDETKRRHIVDLEITRGMTAAWHSRGRTLIDRKPRGSPAPEVERVGGRWSHSLTTRRSITTFAPCAGASYKPLAR